MALKESPKPFPVLLARDPTITATRPVRVFCNHVHLLVNRSKRIPVGVGERIVRKVGMLKVEVLVEGLVVARPHSGRPTTALAVPVAAVLGDRQARLRQSD